MFATTLFQVCRVLCVCMCVHVFVNKCISACCKPSISVFWFSGLCMCAPVCYFA